MAKFLVSSSLVVWLWSLWAGLMPAEANTFKSAPVQPAAAAQNEQDGKVMVFDNAYLDKHFAPTRVTETGGVQEYISNASLGHAVSASIGAGFSEIAPNTSLLKGITRRTSARRAAGLRLAENGRKAVQNKQYQKAIHYLEKALSIDASPFVHFYLARAHYQLAAYQRSLEFLEVAESGFEGHAQWLSELAVLRRALSAASVAAHQSKRNVGWTNED